MTDPPGAATSGWSFAGLATTTVAAVAAHIAGGGSMSATGPLLSLDHFFTLAAVAALAILILAVGSTALRIAGVEVAGATTRLTFGMVLGSGVVATGVLGVSAAVGVGPLQLGGALLALGWVARGEIAAAPGRVVSAGKELLAAHGTGWPRSAAGFGVAVLVVCLLLLALPPATDWDSLAYHLDVPAEWLAAGRLHVPEDNYHVAFVGLVHLLYLPLLAIGASAGPSVLSAVFALLAAMAAFALAAECFGSRAGAIAFWLVWASPILILIGVTPRIDVTLTLFLLTAHHAVLLPSGERPGVLLLAGVMIGLAAGVKLLAVLYGLAITPLLVLRAVRTAGARPMRTVQLLSGVGLVAFAAWSPWLLKNWVLLGAPLYPFFANLRVESWLAPLYGTSLEPVGLDPAVLGFHEQMRQPFSLLNFLFRPGRLTPDAHGALGVPNLALLLAPSAAVLPKGRTALAIAGPGLMFVAFVLVFNRFTSLRYLVPAIPALTIATAAVVDHLLSRMARLTRGVILVATLAMALPAARAVTAILDRTPAWPYVHGEISRAQFLGRYWETTTYSRAVEWANSRLATPDKLLLLFEARGYYFAVPHMQDMIVRNWAYLRAAPNGDQCLRGSGVTHVLVNDRIAAYYKGRGARLETLGWEHFGEFEARCLDLVHEDTGFRVFRVRRE